MKKVNVIIEKGKDALWGRIEGIGDFLPVTTGANINEVLSSLKMLIADYVEHEGQEDKKWKNIDPESLSFEIHYDLRAFFDEFDFLNASSIAAKANINRSLLSQYINGVKYPSDKQAKRVETAIHEMAKKMNSVSLVGSTL